MIKYALVCEREHAFESWFRSSEDYDLQIARGYVECPSCQTKWVSKAVMAPNIARAQRRGDAESESPAAASEAPQPMALIDENSKAVREAMRDLRAKIIGTSVDVGPAFVDQARRMHEGEIPQRAIRGEATLGEAKQLLEEGVPVMPIPTLPEERN